MKPLEEVIQIKDELEKKLIQNAKVTAIDIGTRHKGNSSEEEYIIRVFVNDPEVSASDLGLEEAFKGVPVIEKYRKIELH